MMKHFFQKPNSARRVAFQLTIAATILIATPIFLVGCGSGGGFTKTPTSSTSRKVGKLSIKVTWPARTGRLIPDASESIVVVLTKGSQTLRQQTLVRPAEGQPLTTVTTFDDLPVGTDYTLGATAFPNADGTGVAQAKASVVAPFAVVDNKQTTVPLTLGSTITQIVVEEAVTGSLGIGRSRTLTAVAMDADGNIVITSTPKISFALKDPAGATTLTPDNTTPAADAILTVVKPPTKGTVTVTVTATDAESGKSGSLDLIITATGIDTDASWAKFHADARNTGRLAANLTGPTGTVSDFFAANDAIVFSSPAVDKDGTVYIGAYDGNIYAINPNGTVKWKTPTGDVVESSPAIGLDGAIYCGSSDGKLYCIDAATGTIRYTFVADGAIYGSPTISTDGYVYFGTTDSGSTLYAIDGLSGELRWQYTAAGGGIQTTPAIVGSGDSAVIYFGAQDATVHALHANDGTDAFPVFRADDSIYSSSCAIGDDGTVYFGTLGGRFYALNADLTKKWSTPFDAGAPIYGTPALSRDGTTVYFGILDNFSGLNQNFVYALNTTDGTKAWSFATADGITASPAIGADNTLYVTSLDRNLYALNTDGTLKWSAMISGTGSAGDTTAIESSPGFGPNGAIYFGSTDGKVHIVK